MSHERRSPKRFYPPKAWRARNFNPATEAKLTEILKELWPDASREHTVRVYPKWADLAYARHWMTYAQRQAVSWKERRPHPLKALYEESPLFGMIPRSA